MISDNTGVKVIYSRASKRLQLDKSKSKTVNKSNLKGKWPI